ncbi:DUF1648 domain-containing protein [Chitinophaga pendula]|uniref:DUF1648 domain-containing protein n=1 Tax=Chitinophaga TaxID=79328 RepID=UPI000BAECB7A|nr:MULTISPECIES: DUF1648 domain-containing protein [Chitinophaga]ASZ14160.1 hypothetical protein CK934_26025 [Chitinophaga sp. MD30]UCJ08205.1 DUF1648 domain-containing protein [Chitinophaga pendula]
MENNVGGSISGQPIIVFNMIVQKIKEVVLPSNVQRRYIVMSIVTALMMIAHFLIITLSYAGMPARIPTHYNIRGEADAYGDKSNIWSLLIVSFTVFVVLSILIQSSFIYKNYKGDPENWGVRDEQRGNATKRLLIVLRMFCALIFLIIAVTTITIALG